MNSGTPPTWLRLCTDVLNTVLSCDSDPACSLDNGSRQLPLSMCINNAGERANGKAALPSTFNRSAKDCHKKDMRKEAVGRGAINSGTRKAVSVTH